jgi:hypothetical protein
MGLTDGVMPNQMEMTNLVLKSGRFITEPTITSGVMCL